MKVFLGSLLPRAFCGRLPRRRAHVVRGLRPLRRVWLPSQNGSSWIFLERFFLDRFPPAEIPVARDTFAFLQAPARSKHDPPVRADQERGEEDQGQHEL